MSYLIPITKITVKRRFDDFGTSNRIQFSQDGNEEHVAFDIDFASDPRSACHSQNFERPKLSVDTKLAVGWVS
jgi:hypothetical protein